MSLAASVVLVGHIDRPVFHDTPSRVVRFDNECVLIPECSPINKRPRVVTKSYSLPLWKRRSQPISDSEGTDDPPSSSNARSNATPLVTPQLSSSPEETHVVLKVPIPSFVRRSSRSPSKGRSPSSSPTLPLSPCLVQRLPLGPSSSHPNLSPIPNRRPSLPIYQRRKDDPTVPLRACCQDCMPVTEESLKEGSGWQEKFTKGARRRRSASLDNSHSPYKSLSTPITKPPFSPSSYDERMPPPTLSITVDEVDKRRKSQEHAPEERSRASTSSPTSTRYLTSTRPFHQFSGHDRDSSGESSSSLPPFTDDSERTRETQLPKRKSSPIAEEDENELFPLPSPRRSPNTSQSSSLNSSPKPSRTPSPTASAACLHPLSAVSRPKITLRPTSSEEVLVSAICSQRDKGKGKASETVADSTPKAPKPALSLAFPNSSAKSNEKGRDTIPNSPTTPTSALASSSLSFGSTSTSYRPSLSPSSSPRVSTTKGQRKNSFTLPFLKATEVIKGASVDVLKGVSSIGGSGSGGGITGAV